MTNPFKLYARRGSGSFAVEVALDEIGAPYEKVWVSKDAAAVASYREINPTGRVPALVLPDGVIMIESAAMLIHLALSYPAALLAPAPATNQHARFLQWMVFLSANVYESVLRIYYPARYSIRGEIDADAIKRQAITECEGHLGIISGALQPFVLGGYSIADVYLYMLTGWYPTDRTALFARFPALGAHFAAMAARPAIQKIEAEHAQ